MHLHSNWTGPENKKNTYLVYLLRFEYTGKRIAKATVGIEKCLEDLKIRGQEGFCGLLVD